MNKFISIILFLFILTSCASYESQLYSEIDNQNKTIGMPASNQLLAGDLKDLFRKNGWKILIIEKGDVTTEGTTGDNTQLNTNLDSSARYMLYLSQGWMDKCFNLKYDWISYDVTIVDNQSGEQVFYSEGNDCQTKIIDQLEIDLSAFW